MKAEQFIKNINQILSSGSILPGGITARYNVCGKAKCRCKDKKNPKKHGPYNILSYAVEGKDSTIFIKEKNLVEANEMIERFHALKKQINLLGLEYVRLIRESSFDTTKHPQYGFNLSLKNGKNSNVVEGNRENWKNKALLRQQKIMLDKVKIRDIEQSRGKWKQKANERNVEIKRLMEKINGIEKAANDKKKRGRSRP